MDKEIWKSVTVKGFENYDVSDLGRIRKRVKYKNGKINYLYINNAPNGKDKSKRITTRDSRYKAGYKAVLLQDIILKTFGLYKEGYVVIHLDGNKSNNALTNLKQITQKELSQKIKKEGKLHTTHFKIAKCDIDSHEKIKVYTYYSDAAMDILKERGYTESDFKTQRVKEELQKVLQHIRYILVRSKNAPEAYGYYWKREKDEKE